MFTFVNHVFVPSKTFISELKKISDYKTKGKEINEKYCATKDNCPIMLPPAPKQTYIDCYLDKEGDDVPGEEQKKVEGGKRRQADNETEVEMY